MKKTVIRKRLLTARNNLDGNEYLQRSRQAQRLLIAADVFRRAGSLALYSPIRNEVATHELFRIARDAGKKVCFPKVVGEQLSFAPVKSLAELSSGAFGVAEPAGEGAVGREELDLIVVPGVAFDARGHRLGYGRGFYDRFLSGREVGLAVVGLCFDFQLCSNLPEEGHDQRLDFVVTETRFIPCHIGVAGSS